MHRSASVGVAIGALAGAELDASASIRWASQVGFSCVQLSVTQRGLRSFEMDDGARRGVRAALASAGLTAAGVDFLIPAADWTSAERAQRAADAFQAAVALSASLGRIPLVVALPASDALEVGAMSLRHADHHGVPVANVGEPSTWPAWAGAPESKLFVAIDTAQALLGGGDPVGAVAHAGNRLAHVRIGDVDRQGVRGAPGVLAQGRLDWNACLLAASLSGRDITPVLDPTGWAQPTTEAEQSLRFIQAHLTDAASAWHSGRTM